MMTIEIKINNRLVGGATIRNISDLAELSDYDILAVEQGSDQTGMTDQRHNFRIGQHARKQSLWALVSKVATRALSMSGETP